MCSSCKVFVTSGCYEFSWQCEFDEQTLKERQKSLSIDQQNIAKVIATVVKREPREILEKIHQRTTFDPEQAKSFGLVTHIDSLLIPARTPYEVVRETEAFPSQHRPIQGATNLV